MKIFMCEVEKNGIEADVFVAAESQEEAKFALTSDPAIKVIGVYPFLAKDQITTDDTGFPRLLVDATGFKGKAERSKGGYAGMEVCGLVKKLIDVTPTPF